MNTMTPRKTHSALFLLSISVLVACGKDEAAAPRATAHDTPATAALPLTLNSLSGCTIDADCAQGRFCFQSQCVFECASDVDCAGNSAICGTRGRCGTAVDLSVTSAATTTTETAATTGQTSTFATAEPPPSSRDFEPSVSVLSTSDPVMHVVAGQSTATFHVSLSGPIPESGIAYTISRSDAPFPDAKLYHTPRSSSGIDISLPVGNADPQLGKDAAVVNITLDTSLGAYRIALLPEYAVGGYYVGQAKPKVFGTRGLPIAFQLVTQPEQASLESAQKAWVALPSAMDSLFSPVEAYPGAPDYVVVPLTFDPFVKRWVAVTDFEYRLGESALLQAAPGQVRRVMRFELEPTSDRHLVGKFSDRWRGLYEARSSEGILDFVDVLFEGDVDLQRSGDALSYAALPQPLPAEQPRVFALPAPATTHCTAAEQFPASNPGLADPTVTCGELRTTAAFAAAPAEAQASCALAAAAAATAQATTTAAIASYLDGSQKNASGKSFGEFLADCAKGVGGTCVPTEQVLCARQLLALAYYNQQHDTPLTQRLVATYQDITREAFFGRQLAAFKNDNDTRLTWLKTTDYPAIVTSAVEDLVTKLLDDWQTNVLDVELGILKGYFDSSGLAVLSRTTSGDAQVARQRLLAQVIQSWRGTMDALVTAANRWHEAYSDSTKRQGKTAFLQKRLLDLYLTAGILTNLATDAQVGYQATAFGSGFSELMRSSGKLGQSYDDYAFSRDGEVVVATSLDPSSNNATLLTKLQDSSESAIAAAADSVQSVLRESEAEALNETELYNRLNNQINDLRDDLVNLCGLPIGCTAQDFRTSKECSVRVDPGQCGFALERATGDYLAFNTGNLSTSEAGRSLLSYADASRAIGIAAEELRADSAKLTLELSTLESLATNLQQWNVSRLSGIDDLKALLDKQSTWEEKSRADLKQALLAKANTRAAQIARMQKNFANWNSIRISGAQSDFTLETAASVTKTVAEGLRNAAEATKDFAEATAESMPKSVGAANDVTAPARGATLFSAAGAVLGMRVTAIAADAASTGVEIALGRQQALRDAELTDLGNQASLDDAMTEQELDTIEERLTQAQAANDSAAGDLQATYDVAKAQREAELAYSRDMTELLKRRTSYLQLLEGHAELELRLERAKLGGERSKAEYLGVVQRAQLLNARLSDLENQRANVTELVGTPGIVFARANRLTQAENRLDRAKAALFDWLVALEYFAVRPFMDQRLQIMLARNPYQLEEIGKELERLQGACGGAVNDDTTVLSLRDELLKANLPIMDTASGQTVSVGERFRSILRQGHVPIDKRVRYTSDLTVGDLLKSQGRVLAATFNIDLNSFANLASTCNTKIGAIEVQLVGKLGTARPTVTILYDGSSKLRSCQPGIEDYVELVGRKRTNFGEVTSLRVPGRAISPVATINEWRTGEKVLGNTSLSGLPLASQYTILIDTQIGENAALDFDRLEDIQLRIKYTYSDVFAPGQCD